MLPVRGDDQITKFHYSGCLQQMTNSPNINSGYIKEMVRGDDKITKYHQNSGQLEEMTKSPIIKIVASQRKIYQINKYHENSGQLEDMTKSPNIISGYLKDMVRDDDKITKHY